MYLGVKTEQNQGTDKAGEGGQEKAESTAKEEKTDG